MYSYHMIQWLLFFYIYCFLGWVWESCYVSAHKKKWVNRGFMHGPFLPIYGFGAITVLITTIPFKDNLVLVYICGMIGATILEYVAGEVMEYIFHVRYWDYSNQRFNLNGHICLMSSLAWGAFSILMIKGIHCPIELFVQKIPYHLLEAVTLLLTVYITFDFTQSFNEAMDLKELLENLTESNEEFRKIRKRIDVVIAIIDSDRKELKQRVLASRKTIEEKVQISKLSGIKLKIVKEKEEESARLLELSEKVGICLDAIKERLSKESRNDELEKIKTELESFLVSVRRQKHRIYNCNEKSYHRSLKLLKRNPNTVSKKYEEALKKVKDFGKED